MSLMKDLFTDEDKSPSAVVNDLFKEQKVSSKRETMFGSTSPLERAATLGISGIPAAIGGVKPREALQRSPEMLPILGQMMGGPALAALKVPQFLGSTAGFVGGELAKRGLKGENMTEGLGKQAGVTAAIEGALRIPAFTMFKNLRAQTKLTEESGKTLGKYKNQLATLSESNPQFRVATQNVSNIIDNALKNITDQSGSVGSVIRRFKNTFSKGNEITARQLMEFETRLGDAIKFDKTGATKAVNRALNNAGKTIRNKVSGLVDNLAVNAGIKDFPKLSKEVSKLITQAYPKRGGIRDTMLQLGASGSLGVLLGGATGNPAVGALGTAGLLGALNPNIQKLAYKGLEKTGIGRGLTLGLSNSVRQDLEKNRKKN